MKLQDVFRRLAEELDAEEQAEADAETQAEAERHAARVEELEREVREMRRLLAEGVREAEEESSEEEGAGEEESSEEELAPAARRTRPGRKSSMAYDWDVDERGEVVELDVARVYSGEDEPDEVEILEPEEEESSAA